jgi:hypothetical protein
MAKKNSLKPSKRAGRGNILLISNNRGFDIVLKMFYRISLCRKLNALGVVPIITVGRYLIPGIKPALSVVPSLRLK